MEHVNKVLAKLRKAGLQVDIDKSEFHVTETKFLGLIISVDGIKMDPAKIQTIVEWEEPKTLKQVQAFLGFRNFYRRFIRNFAKIAKPWLGSPERMFCLILMPLARLPSHC